MGLGSKNLSIGSLYKYKEEEDENGEGFHAFLPSSKFRLKI